MEKRQSLADQLAKLNERIDIAELASAETRVKALKARRACYAAEKAETEARAKLNALWAQRRKLTEQQQKEDDHE